MCLCLARPSSLLHRNDGHASCISGGQHSDRCPAAASSCMLPCWLPAFPPSPAASASEAAAAAEKWSKTSEALFDAARMAHKGDNMTHSQNAMLCSSLFCSQSPLRTEKSLCSRPPIKQCGTEIKQGTLRSWMSVQQTHIPPVPPPLPLPMPVSGTRSCRGRGVVMLIGLPPIHTSHTSHTSQ